MSDKLPILLSGIVADAMTGFASGGAGTTGAVAGIILSELLHKRLETARDVLLDELRSGDKKLAEASEVDEIVAILERYARAAREGAARLNLRLMAKVIAGQAHRGNLIADEFLYYADILASLRQEEIILIATLHRQRYSTEVAETDGGARAYKAQTLTRDKLVPGLFPSEKQFMATLGSTTRTGLVIGSSAIGTMVYQTSPLMDTLETLAPFREALEAEP